MGQPRGPAPTSCPPSAGTAAPSAAAATTESEEMIFSGVDVLKLSASKGECPSAPRVLGTAGEGEVAMESGFGRSLSSFTDYLLLFPCRRVEEDASSCLQHSSSCLFFFFSISFLLLHCFSKAVNSGHPWAPFPCCRAPARAELPPPSDKESPQSVGRAGWKIISTTSDP